MSNEHIDKLLFTIKNVLVAAQIISNLRGADDRWTLNMFYIHFQSLTVLVIVMKCGIDSLRETRYRPDHHFWLLLIVLFHWLCLCWRIWILQRLWENVQYYLFNFSFTRTWELLLCSACVLLLLMTWKHYLMKCFRDNDFAMIQLTEVLRGCGVTYLQLN